MDNPQRTYHDNGNMNTVKINRQKTDVTENSGSDRLKCTVDIGHLDHIKYLKILNDVAKDKIKCEFQWYKGCLVFENEETAVMAKLKYL